MLRLCHALHDYKNNASLTSNSQCSIVVTTTYVLSHATGAGL